MTVKKHQRFSKEQQIALLQEFMASELSGREYAALKNVGYSTLTRWASQLGVSLAKTSLPSSGEMPIAKTTFQNSQHEGFSFINLTEEIKEVPPTCGVSLFSGHAVQESASPCGLEIKMPNGVMLKVDQVPFGALWPQIVEFVRALA